MKNLNKIILLSSIIFSFMFTSCKQDKQPTQVAKNQMSYEDSIKLEMYLDSAYEAQMKKIELNSEIERETKSQKSPIQVTDVSFYYGEYSNFQTIRIKYKNISDKKVVAMKFEWYDLKDAFGDEVKPTYEGGMSEQVIGSGRKSTSEWDILEQGVKIGKAYCSEVVFEDGTKWEL